MLLWKANSTEEPKKTLKATGWRRCLLAFFKVFLAVIGGLAGDNLRSRGDKASTSILLYKPLHTGQAMQGLSLALFFPSGHVAKH
eukprot:2014487-Karenia_brevis.AAC.1